MMTWQEARDSVVERSGVGRYGDLCADEHPDHEWWRAEMIRMESQPYEAPVQYPSLTEQIGNALAAGVKFLMSGGKLVSAEEHERRLSICQGGCEWYDPDQSRCRACGCVDTWKARLESQRCPKGHWEAEATNPPTERNST
jgi:hypothetical protein